MPPPALSATELLDWNDVTARRWQTLLTAHPEGLDLPCDVYGVKSVGELLRHIFVVEMRYAERLSGGPVTAYEQLPDGPVEQLLAVHDSAMAKYRQLVADTSVNWDEKLEFTTLSMGTRSATRRVILFHAMLHGIRHYAQLATLVRQHGIKPDWPMDYLSMGMS